jgi:hypothetical protein
MRTLIRSSAAMLTGVPFGLLYGALARFAFDQNRLSDAFATLSAAFLLAVPVAVGALAVWFTRGEARTAWLNALVAPSLATLFGALVAGLFLVEAFVCVVMALPVLLLMGVIGGLLTCFVLRRRAEQNNTPLLGLLLLAPFLVAPIEEQFAVQSVQATVDSQIEIAADPATVWANLIRVAPIQPEERSFRLVFDLLGAPRPLAATLDHEGVGGVRRGLFEQNLAFIETITVWEPDRRIDWSIAADTSQVTQAPWPEIGGRYFEVSAAGYRIEPLDNGHVLLHLSSTHRLSTHLNGYGLLWTRWGLAEFQREILHILKVRAERGAAS